jgi:hypothetical protein
MCMLKSYINPSNLKALHAKAKQSSSASDFAHSDFHVVNRMEPLLDRLEGRSGQTEENHRSQRANLHRADAGREVR